MMAMPNGSDTLTDAEREGMKAAMDRLIPAVDELAGAGSMGLLRDVERMGAQHDRYGRSLLRFVRALSSVPSAAADFLARRPEQQDAAIKEFEAASPMDFANVLDLVYIAYYSRPEVHARIAWRTGPLQPQGFELPQFDESILDTVRQRAQFWRPISE